jgi:hypothetical protein
VDPKRLLEITQDGPSPNVLVQNLLGVARSEAAPDGAKRRSRRSVDGVFSSESDDPNAAGKSTAAKSTAAKTTAAKTTMPKSATTKSAAPPPKTIPPAERRPGGCGEPCAGWTPFGGGF